MNSVTPTTTNAIEVAVDQRPQTSRTKSPQQMIVAAAPKPKLQLASATKDLGLLATNQLFQAYRRPQTAAQQNNQKSGTSSTASQSSW